MIYFVITIVSVLIGFYLGTKVDSSFILEDSQRVMNKLTKVKNGILKNKSDLNPGIIKRPSAQEVYLRNEAPEVKASKKAIKDSLDQIPELAEARKKVQELKKMGVL